jgi:uncharacterized membrane protein YfcA
MHGVAVVLDPGTAAILLADVSLAYFLKGFSGFGPALVFMPVASMIYNPELALVTSAFIDLFVGLALVRALTYSREELLLAGRLVLGMASGTVLGAAFAGILPTEVLLVLIAVTVAGLGANLALRSKPAASAAAIGGTRIYAGCFAGGATGGLVGISGPFVVAGAASLDKGAFRRVLVVVFLAEGLLKLVVYWIAGVWSANAIPLAVLVSPAVVLGLTVGFRSHLRVSERRFTQAVGVLLTMMGTVALATAVGH